MSSNSFHLAVTAFSNLPPPVFLVKNQRQIHATPKSDFKKSRYWKSRSYVIEYCNVG